jgi:hypothetical protein
MLRICPALAFIVLTAAGQQAPQPPFKSGVELVMVDAQVVDQKGNPIPGLATATFQVTIDGKIPMRGT